MLRHRRTPQVSRPRSQPGIRRRLRIGVLDVLALGMLVSLLLVVGCSNDNGEAVQREVAPDFTVPSTEGSFTLSEQKGNVVFLFYSSQE